MGLKCGIVGITNSGKTTLFNCMSKTKAQITNFAFSTGKSNIGICTVPDQRLTKIHQLIKADELIYATVEIVDIPGLAKGSSMGEGIGNAFLADIRLCDALIHVLRCFDDANLPHIDETINPVRDIETVDLELQIKDLEQIERKIQKLDKAARVGDKEARQHIEILEKYKNHLENFQNIRTLETNEVEKKVVEDMMLLTAKPVIYVCNVDEKSVLTGNVYSNAVKDFFKNTQTEILIIASKLEAEISELDDADQLLFLEDVGLQEPGVNKLLQAAYKSLNLISFFTVGGKENRAWTIAEGMLAPQAAGVIHSDLERGFIRAEVIAYDDLIAYGSEINCKNAGKLSVEGKNYVVKDGNILHIRFNV
ncbi:MAG: redox-regulated ATPase YchF [Bacteroidales bacterium]|nr:redox-regulated ATPase YchF [Bacteroidales bacterium]MDD4209591.1 redox-regulated ATPase YchF [Bacteroidales bacterium]